MKTVQDLVSFAKSKVGGHYLYGYKGELVTAQKNRTLQSQYPGTWTAKYRAVADGWIGQYAVDCSGLISWCTGKIRGSYQYEETATEKVSYKKGMDLSNYLGWAAWMPGHIGIVTGKDEITEARGQAYGVVQTKASQRPFTKLLKIVDIDYSIKDPDSEVGWHKDGKGWWYRHTKGHGPDTYVHDCVKALPSSKGVMLFAFDSNGYMDTSDSLMYKLGDLVGFSEFGNIELGNLSLSSNEGLELKI